MHCCHDRLRREWRVLKAVWPALSGENVCVCLYMLKRKTKMIIVRLHDVICINFFIFPFSSRFIEFDDSLNSPSVSESSHFSHVKKGF
jgi:hypothetical protein